MGTPVESREAYKEKERIQEQLALLSKKISEFNLKETQLKREYSYVIEKYKKAENYGMIEMPSWLSVILGIIGFIIGAVAMMITRDYVQFSNPIIDYLFLILLLGISLIGIPAVLIMIMRYMLEDMVSDILKLPHRCKYNKYTKAKRKIGNERSILVSQKQKLSEKLVEKKNTQKTTNRHINTTIPNYSFSSSSTQEFDARSYVKENCSSFYTSSGVSSIENDPNLTSAQKEEAKRIYRIYGD